MSTIAVFTLTDPYEHQCAIRASRGDIAPLDKTEFIRPPPHLIARLLHLHKAACAIATTAPASKALESA